MNIMKWTAQIVLVSGVAGILAACASGTGWQKPGADPAAARSALSECRARANVQVEDRYGRDVNGGGSGGMGDEFRSSVARNDAIRMLDRAVAECMTEKGYLRK